MQKRKCILKNSVSGAVCELEFDLDKSLVNNIRVWCHTYGEQMKHFIPENYFLAIMKDHVPNDMVIKAQICFGNQYVHVSQNEVLGLLVGALKKKEDIPEIRMNIDNYVWSKNELDIYQTPEETEITSGKGQLIVVYHEIDNIKVETFEEKQSDEEKKNVSRDVKNEESYSKKKKKSKILPIFLGIAILGGAGAYGATVLMNDPAKDLKEMMSAQSYEEVVTLYNEEISGDAKKENKVNHVLDAHLNQLMESYTKDNSKHDSVVAEFSVFADIENEELSNKIKDYLSQIQLNEEMNAIYQDAEEKYNSGEYLNAMLVYMSITEEMKFYEQAQERYVECRNALLEVVSEPQTVEDYESYINIVEEYILVIEDEEFLNYKTILLDSYAMLMRDNARTETLSNAETAFSQGNYSNAFDILKQGLEVLPEDIILQDKVKEYQGKYVDIIRSQANAQVQSKNYSQALNIVTIGISLYDCEEFRAMISEIEQLKASDLGTHNAPTANFFVYDGTIEKEDQIIEYEFTTVHAGRYGISASGLVNGFKTIVKVYSVKTGVELKSYRGMTNTTTFYVDLEANEKYKLTVEQYTGMGSYQLQVGQPKAVIDVNAVSKVNDSIQYVDQINQYTFTPEYAGNYRLDFANIKSGFTVNVYVYDSLNYEVARYRGLSNGRGLTMDLNAGENYRIEVIFNNGMGDYEMSIGRQKFTSAISSGITQNDTIQFVDQTNYYTFTPIEAGKYNLTFSEMESGFTVNVYVLDELGYETARYKGLSNGRTLTFDANAGEQYKVKITYNANVGKYKFALNTSAG